MKNKIIDKIRIILILIVMLMSFYGRFISLGVENTSHLIKIGTADHHLKYLRDSGNYTYVQCSIVGYNENGKFYPAYCINRDLPGAESGEYDVVNEEIFNNSYITLKNSNILNNNAIWRIVKNGYPYKTYQEMGLQSEFDAFAVTKFAIYCILEEANLEDYYAEPDDEIAVEMLEVLKNLVSIGVNGTETISDNYFELSKIGELNKEDGYYVQDYNIVSKIENKDEFDIEIIGNDRLSIGKIDNNSFELIIPEDLLCSDIEAEFKIISKVKNYPIFFGVAYDENTQDYIITSEKYSEVSQNFKSTFVPNNSKIVITKKDADTGDLIKDTKIVLKDQNKNIIHEEKTDEEGKIYFSDLYKGTYYISEIEANKEYVLNLEEQKIDLDYNEQKEIEILNLHKKGNLKISKFDSDNKKIKLEGIEFELYDEKNELIGKYTTDSNGEILVKNLNTGKYKIKEIKTKQGYELSEELKFEINYNEVTELEIGNKRIKGKLRIIKIDKDDENIRLEGVEFNILDENENIVDTLITDKNGEAVSKELPVYQGKYYIKEIETKEGYILEDSKVLINLEPKIKGETKLIISNEKEKITEPEKEISEEIVEQEKEVVEEIIEIEEVKKLPKTGY